MDRGAWQATVHEVERVRHDLVTKPPPPPITIYTTTNYDIRKLYKEKLQGLYGNTEKRIYQICDSNADCDRIFFFFSNCYVC